jgi:Ca2+-binding EF-hand superfamily protein
MFETRHPAAGGTMRNHSPKKSENIEIRVPHGMKNDFMARCRTEGRSASDVLRGFIEDYLAAGTSPKMEDRPIMPRIAKPAAAAVTAGALSLLFLLTPAVSANDLEAAFRGMDLNGDGAVTLAEFTTPSAHGDMVLMRHDGAPLPGPDAKPVVLPLHGKQVPVHPQAKAPPPEMLRTVFAEQDSDHDGVLRFTEFAEHHQTMLRGGFAAMDANGDGGIDAGELAKATADLPGHKPAFASHDANGDGKVSWEEFTATHSG